jgi:pimeloyl-ACP methyl ester carboxylesterase
MLTVHINGFDCAYDVRGEGTPLLLLHGGMGIGADWRHVFPTDPDGYQAIVPDLRGHGRSSNPAGTFTFRQCAEDVLALADHLGVDTFDAIGMSMGAKTLLHVATQQPRRVGAMVLVSATPRFPDSVRPMMAAFTPAMFDALPAAEQDALRARHVRGDDQIRALHAMMGSFATSFDDMAFTAGTLATITARTLVVHGDRDALYPIESAVELYRGIPQSALWVVPHGGHGPIFGPQSGAFREQALSFLRATSLTK